MLIVAFFERNEAHENHGSHRHWQFNKIYTWTNLFIQGQSQTQTWFLLQAFCLLTFGLHCGKHVH